MKRFLAILCTVAMLLSLPVALPLSAGAAEEQGFLFSEDDVFMAGGAVKTPPKTISLWVKIPAGLTSRAYTPLSNFIDENHEALSVEIHNNGQPRAYIRRNVNGYEGDGTIKSVREECKWSINLADGTWHHVEWVIGEGVDHILCYVDGELITNKSLNKADKKVTTALAANPNPMRLGAGWKPGVTTEYFRGALGSVACYSDLRTAEEVRSDYNAGKTTYRKAAADYADAGLLYAYDMMATDFINDLSPNGGDIALPVTATSGMSFDGKEDVVMANSFKDKAPYTFEAEIFAPIGVSTRAGVIVGNFMDAAACSMNVEINTNGHPRFYFVHAKTDSSGNVTNTDITFDGVDVRTGDWAHLAIVFDEAKNTVACYLDGELKQTKSCTEDYYEGTFDWPLLIGSDYRAGNAQYFKGNIRSVALYSDVRSAEEIKADSAAISLANTDANCLGAWELDDAATHGTVYKDLGPAGNDVTYTDYWFDKTEAEEASDYAYSFAIIGDTQGINLRDAKNGNTKFMDTLYDWLVANKETKNIQYVIGMGDITDTFSLSGTYHTAEWKNAEKNIGKLDKAGIPHIQVRGNHDHPMAFNEYFGEGTAYGDSLEGTYNGTIANAYKRFTIGNTKWLLITLDNGAAGGVIEWASELIERYSDHKVIISTHAYMYGNGEYHTDRYAYSPSIQTVNMNGTRITGGHNGDELWAKLISQHENITLMLCGHNYGNVIPVRQDMGVHGNIVTQVLVDFQWIDQKEIPAGLVTMFYFSADGSTVEVETYSPIQEKYYRAANQFTMSLTGERDLGRESDSYGWLQEGRDYCFEIIDPAMKTTATTAVVGLRYKTLAEVNAALNKDGLVVKMLGNVRSNHTREFAFTTAADFIFDGGGWIYDSHGWDEANTYVWSFSQRNTVAIRNLTMVSSTGCIYAKNVDLILRSGARLYGGWSYGYKNENYYVADFGTNGTFTVPGANGTARLAQNTLRPAGGGAKVTVEKGAAVYAGGSMALYCDGDTTVTVNGGYFESHQKGFGTVATQHSSKSDKTLVINGGTFANYYFDAEGNVGHALENGRGHVTVNGGTFIAYGAPFLSYNGDASWTTHYPSTVINGGMFISEAPEGSAQPLGERANGLIVVDDPTGNSTVAIVNGAFLNRRGGTTAQVLAGNNSVTVTGSRFFSLTTASDNLSLTAAQKAATVKLEGREYYIVEELLHAASDKAPVLADGAQAHLSIKNAGIRFVSTVKKINGATYGTLIVPTEDVIKAMALAGGITEENLIKVSATGEIAKIKATKKDRVDNGDGTLTFHAALTGLTGLEDVSFTAISYTVWQDVTYYTQPQLLVNSRTISAVAAAALADVSFTKGGESSHHHACNEAYLFNDAGLVAYHRYDSVRQQILAALMNETDLAACKAAVIAKRG